MHGKTKAFYFSEFLFIAIVIAAGFVFLADKFDWLIK